MKIPSKVASGTLILIGLGWLSSLFWPSRGWSDRSVNQMPSNAQEGVPSQNFAPPQGQGSFTDDNNSAAGTENTDPSAQPAVPQTNQSAAPTSTTPASTASPSPTTSPGPTTAPSPSPTTSPNPIASPSPSAVPEPIRAGW